MNPNKLNPLSVTPPSEERRRRRTRVIYITGPNGERTMILDPFS